MSRASARTADLRVGSGFLRIRAAASRRTVEDMTTPVPTRVPVLPVAAAGVGAQVAGALVLAVLPGFPGFGAILALGLTALAAKIATSKLDGPSVPRAGLAIGVVSAGVGLVLSGFGLVSILLAGITVVAGVGGAVLGRPEVRPGA